MRTIDIETTRRLAHYDSVRTLHNRAQQGLQPQPIRRGRGIRYLYRVDEVARWLGLTPDEVAAAADLVERERSRIREQGEG